MGRLLKIILTVVGAVFALILIVGIVFSILFDPNDYRDDIATAVRDETGRELVIEGDLDVSIFPWLAIQVGKTTLSNAEGFGDEAFLAFDSARIGVRLLPLIFGKEVAVGGASIEGLRVNLAVDAAGRTNWDDLAGEHEEAQQPSAGEQIGIDAAAGSTRQVRIGGVRVTDAALTYVNKQLNERYEISSFDFATGAIVRGEPVSFNGDLEFSAQPAGTSGSVSLEMTGSFDDALVSLADFSIGGTVEGVAEIPVTFSFTAPAITLDTEKRSADVGQLEIALLDVKLSADVEPFSYADSPQPSAALQIDAFSPRSLMRTLNIEAPEMADPDALTRFMFEGKTRVGEKSIALSGIELVLDDTTFRGELTVPRESNGVYRLNLAGDSIDLGRYMAPADESATAPADADAPPLEIPVELIRAFNTQGKVTLGAAELGGMKFENIEVGLNSSNGQMRVHPLTAEFFDGNYQGDIRINAAASTPVLTVNERINDVSLAALGKSMFDTDRLSGTVNGVFALSGRGFNMAEIQRDLDGNLSFTLKDGAWEGVDVWHQLRAARAAFRRQPAPERTGPPRTPFSTVSATATVTDGVLNNQDFFAELPFMQLRGRGTVNLPTAEVNYSLQGRVFEKPELLPGEITAQEVEDLTKFELPLRITGTLGAPKIGIDFEAVMKQRVEKEVEEKVEEVLKDKLKGLFDRGG
ncbi:MAG: AsmA family protein [Woeseiaceae bacterium]|nr:AsmA family protein [Woeseiaceae bacterium]